MNPFVIETLVKMGLTGYEVIDFDGTTLTVYGHIVGDIGDVIEIHNNGTYDRSLSLEEEDRDRDLVKYSGSLTDFSKGD